MILTPMIISMSLPVKGDTVWERPYMEIISHHFVCVLRVQSLAHIGMLEDSSVNRVCIPPSMKTTFQSSLKAHFIYLKNLFLFYIFVQKESYIQYRFVYQRRHQMNDTGMKLKFTENEHSWNWPASLSFPLIIRGPELPRCYKSGSCLCITFKHNVDYVFLFGDRYTHFLKKILKFLNLRLRENSKTRTNPLKKHAR